MTQVSEAAVHPLDGAETLALLRAVIAGAHARIWVLQFLVDPRSEYDSRRDVRYLMHALAEASARGVDVRVVLPTVLDEPLVYDKNLPAARFMAVRGVAVRQYVATRQRPHMHAKAVLVDDELVIGGNVNWTPDAFGGNSEQGIAIRSRPVAEIVARRFRRIWNDSVRMPYSFGPWAARDAPVESPTYHHPLPRTQEEHARSLKAYWPRTRPVVDPYLRTRMPGAALRASLLSSVGGATVRILAGQSYVRAVLELLSGARHQVWVSMMGLRASTTPKLRVLLSALRAARRRGVDVRILYEERDGPDTDWTADVPFLRDGGVAVRRWKLPGHLHTRSLVVDEKDAMIGSQGWTPRSVFLSEEIVFQVTDPHLARRLSERFEAWWHAGAPDLASTRKTESSHPFHQLGIKSP
ncbi:MAG: phosphatidylserine/phosphatidylglycerophosphate/cardiolipin synthase family protein [Sandaracinaceae bacterium]|nr:phosphatidylserine/phosphatidylglycerophosphate/cardiolipin synthase family protein [Sandaracinaceae bacterium]